MLSSPHKIQFGELPREVRVRAGTEIFLSQSAQRAELEERYRAGFDAGQKSLGDELMRQRSQLLEVQNTILRSIERTLPTLAAQCERDLVTLAFEAAGRVVKNLPVTAADVENAVRTGLAELQETAEYQVRLNPEDLTLLLGIQSSVLPSPSNSKVQFLADGTVARAGCVIHTRHGAVEVNREKMFARLEEAAL